MTAQADTLVRTLLEDLDAGRLELPTLPEVALRVRDVVESESSSARDIAEAVSSDPALAARLIQVSNSPLYRGRREIDDVQSAVVRLGRELVRTLVTSLAMRQMFQATTEAVDRRLRELWSHSVQVAAISRALAGQQGLVPDRAMLAGLVHDVGALPLLVRAEEDEVLLADEAAFDALVRELHPALGRAILERWGLPDYLVAVAAEHEDLARDPGTPPDYVDVVIVANLQSRMGSEHPHAAVEWSRVAALRRLGLADDVSTVELAAGSDEAREVEALLSG